MASSGALTPSDAFDEPKFTNQHHLVFTDNDELRSRNREQLIEKLQRVIEEKNASIVKLEEREQNLEDALTKRNNEFRALEEQLRQYEEKTRTYEQLHQLQVLTFEKTIRDCQAENERLCEHVSELTNQLREKRDQQAINQDKMLTIDRIAADTQLWRQKLDSYKATIEEREKTIAELRKEANEWSRKKQTNGDFGESSLQLQIATLQSTLRDREKEIENLKSTLRNVRDTLQPGQLSHESRWRSCNEDIGRHSSTARRVSRSSSTKNRGRFSPPVRDEISPSRQYDTEFLQKKLRTLTDRLANVQQLLVQRDDQIVTLKKVHDKRWLRLKHLQKQYRLIKNELQSYTDDETMQQHNRMNDYSYRKVIRKTKTGCSVCNDQRWRKTSTIDGKKFKRVLKQEDDDGVWNEVTKLRRDNARLINENVSVHEKLDLQQVEINEQAIVIGELNNELQMLNEKETRREHRPPLIPPIPSASYDEQQRLIEELDKKLYELETQRTCLVFDQERLKTNLELCLDEKHQLTQQRNQSNNEIKKLKLNILALQDQIHKLKRNGTPPVLTNKKLLLGNNKRRPMKKQNKRPSCLEMLLDQNQHSTLIDDLDEPSIALNRVNSSKSDGFLTNRRRRRRSCSLCDHHHEKYFDMRPTMKQKKRSSNASFTSKRCGPLTKNYNNKVRLATPAHRMPFTRRFVPPPPQKVPPIRIAPLRRRIEQLESDLTDAKDENDHLNQRLSTTLIRINTLKTTNQKLTADCERLKSDHPLPTTGRLDSASTDGGDSVENLQIRLKNSSLDAARQRKLNKTLQTDNETLSKNIQSLNEKLIHTERDLASKRALLESYKSRLNEQDTNVTRANERSPHEPNDDDRLKSLTEAGDKLRVSIDSYKNRLQAVTREKQNLDVRYTQAVDDLQKLKIRFDDVQAKLRYSEQQLRQSRLSNEQLNQELLTCRHLSEEQLHSFSTKTQESMNKITADMDRTRRRLNEYERFTNSFLHELIRRIHQLTDHLKRTREHQKQRESFSMTMPGYDSAMTTASKILNLTQDDLDDIMSTTDDSFQANGKYDSTDKNEKLRHKVAKLLASQEEFSGKLLKVFNRKLDELQAVDREVTMARNT